MKRLICLLASMVLVLALGAANASATGIGLGVVSGSGDMEVTSSYPSTNEDFDTMDYGFVLDTNLSGDSTFNYRLTLAAANAEIKDSAFDSLNGITLINDFGFGIVKDNPNFRLWMGPEIRLSWLDQTEGDYELDLFSFGFGPVIGANFNIGSTVTLSLTGSYIFHTTNGEFYNASTYWWEDFESDGEMLMIGANVIFRLNE